MFTGLVEKIGKVRALRRGSAEVEIEIEAGFPELARGESVAVDGTCLTVARTAGRGFIATASAETVARTTLSNLSAGAQVHLERALALGDRLGGHLVSGHVDGVGTKVSTSPLGDAVRVTYQVPEALAPFVAPKGSVAVDGVSLTANSVAGLRFDVVLVPYTRANTLLDRRPIGSPVNIEVDLLAKYVARLLGRAGVDGVRAEETLSLDLLARKGFL
jgi:riboflavin synthase